ncbi:unnamed protein product [Linum trigynum]|uniref:Uncharacterized protein n=1 Tax=Linum trigynum TaxID=586398 RepID=A0AAV2DKZ6_9ROSI
MRLKPATATVSLGRNLNPDLDNQEQDLSFVTLLPVDPIPEPFTNPPTKRHSRDNSFEFEFDGSTAKPDQEIIFCGRILTPGRISSSTIPYTYDSDGANYNHNRSRRVQFAAPDHGLYDSSPSANTSPSRSLLMGQAAAGRSKSFSYRHQQQAAASKPKLGPSKSFAYSSSRSSGYAKVTPATEGKKVVGGEGEAVAGGDGRALGRSRSFRKSVSFSRCFPIVSSRHDFY